MQSNGPVADNMYISLPINRDKESSRLKGFQQQHMNDSRSTLMTLEVFRARVKDIKDALEAHDLLDKSIKIRPLAKAERFSVPLKGLHSMWSNDRNEPIEDLLFQLMSSIGMERYIGDVTLSISELPTYHGSGERPSLDIPLAHDPDSSARGTPLEAAIHDWLESIPASMTSKHANKDGQISDNIRLEIDQSNKTSGYTVYPPMLLLPPTALSAYFLDNEISKYLPRLYECLCKTFKVTHIALNGPIPASSLMGDLDAIPNIMRSPTRLNPLYGDFGPSLPASHIPTTSDFETAFWCTARQNGIFQTWAPRYTMFSRGNISEKTRILDVATSNRGQDLGSTRSNYKSKDSMAVDLYAGIGYFAFSYAKAGMAKVLCWEINPWSVEGLKRGAKGNNWKTVVMGENDGYESIFPRIREQHPKFIIFRENNENATRRIQAMLSGLFPPFSHLAPIRHVNCGYLPSSKDSWKTAVDVLDEHQGGWIHVHENIRKSDIDARKAEIVDIFKRLTDGKSGICRVSCDHLERVKSYAPGIIHCVLDISVIISEQ